MVLTEIEQKIVIFQRQNEQKIALIEKSADCIRNQFDHAINSLNYRSQNPKDFKFFELNEKELNKLDKNLLILLKKFEFSKDLQCLMEGFSQEILKSLENRLETLVFESFDVMKNRLNKIANIVAIVEMKRVMKREFLEKQLILKGKTQESDFKNSTFGKKGFLLDDDKENMNINGHFSLKANDKISNEGLLR